GCGWWLDLYAVCSGWLIFVFLRDKHQQCASLVLCSAHTRSVSNFHLSIQPAIDKFLQAGLPAQMFHCGVMSQHVFPRIDLEQMPLRSIRMRTVGFAPRQPPVIHAPLLLAADIAIKCFSPGHLFSSGDPHLGCTAPRVAYICHSFNLPNFYLPITPKSAGFTKFHISAQFAKVYTAIHRTSTINLL